MLCETLIQACQQPNADAIVTGARQVAKALAFCFNVDFRVGIESGLFNVFGVELEIRVCLIFDGGVTTIGTSPRFTYPASAWSNCTTRSRQYCGAAFRYKAHMTKEWCSRAISQRDWSIGHTSPSSV